MTFLYFFCTQCNKYHGLWGLGGFIFVLNLVQQHVLTTTTMFNFFKTKKGYKDVNAAEFNRLLNETPGVVLIDVRTAAEFRQGAIGKAQNMDIMDRNFTHKITALDKDKTYLLYCRSGNRSGSACSIMSDAGFTNVYNLSGGIMSWPY